MNYSRAALGLMSLAVIGGCGAGSDANAKKSTPWGKPAHVRLVNLSSGMVKTQIGTTYKDELQPTQMTYANPVSPGKKYKISANVGGKDLTYEAATEAGQFSTVVIKDGGMSSFISGKSLSRTDGGAIDFINLTEKPVKFDASGMAVDVSPMTSSSVDFANGSIDVKVGDSTVKAELSKGQIWGVYAFNDKGKVKLSGLTLKGTGQAAASGGPSAN